MMIGQAKDYVRFGWQLVTGWRLKHELWIAKLRDADLASYLDRKQSLKVLDLANGRLQPQYKILRAQEHQVYGIDMVNRPKTDLQDYAYMIARRLYERDFRASHSRPGNTLICGDVAVLPFRDESFDLVTSVAAFEHFIDIPLVLEEVYRVIRQDGMLWVLVHLFTSPSGGHNVALSEIPLRAIPNGIDPWDHLRKRRLPFHVPLNEWRRHQYLEAITKHFKVLKHYCAMREGENLLSPEIQAELSGYSPDELTCGAYVIIAQKRTYYNS
jgi:ubiquinone/menaquinone biosynthesis C-methylase UbiE